MVKYEAGFIGAGNMGGALALAAMKKVGGDRVAVSCSSKESTAAKAAKLGCAAANAEEIIADSRYIFLGVKPQMLRSVVQSLEKPLRRKAHRRGERGVRLRPGLRVYVHRGARGRRRQVWPTAREGDTLRSADAARQCRDGTPVRQAPGTFEGRGMQPRRKHHRGRCRTRGARLQKCLHRRR